LGPTRREFLKGLGALVALAAAPAAVELFPTYGASATITAINPDGTWEDFRVGGWIEYSDGRGPSGYFRITSVTSNSFTVEPRR
jgi:hypothetical protein